VKSAVGGHGSVAHRTTQCGGAELNQLVRKEKRGIKRKVTSQGEKKVGEKRRPYSGGKGQQAIRLEGIQAKKKNHNTATAIERVQRLARREIQNQK